MAESTLTSAVLRAFKHAGWLTMHMHSSRHAHYLASTKGFPDILALRGNRLVIAELKGRNAEGYVGTPEPRQRVWLKAWQDFAESARPFFAASSGGVEVYVWGPDNLSNGDVDKVAA
jgi:hypothetical protein